MAAICSGRPGWLGNLGIALLVTWFLIPIISIVHIFKSNSLLSHDIDTANKENTQRLTQMVNDFEILKKQNDALKNFILGERSKSIQRDHLGSVQDKLEKVSVYCDLIDHQDDDRSKHGVPLSEYKELRRRLRKSQEMWYYISAELNKFKKHIDEFTYDQREKEIQDVMRSAWENKKSLIINVDKLRKADGYDKWREKAKDLSDLVQKRFRYLQNPADCNKEKKLICSLNKVVVLAVRFITSRTAF